MIVHLKTRSQTRSINSIWERVKSKNSQVLPQLDPLNPKWKSKGWAQHEYMNICSCTGLAKKFIWIFPHHLVERLKRTFWLTQCINGRACESAESDSVGPEWSLRFHIFNKLPGDASTAGSPTTFLSSKGLTTKTSVIYLMRRLEAGHAGLGQRLRDTIVPLSSQFIPVKADKC